MGQTGAILTIVSGGKVGITKLKGQLGSMLFLFEKIILAHCTVNISVAITIKQLILKRLYLLKQAAPPDSQMKAQLFQLQSITELKRTLTNLSLCTFHWMHELYQSVSPKRNLS